MKKILSLILIAAIMASVLLFTASCAPKAEAKNDAYVALDINPEVEFVVDEKGKVVSFRAANEDAQVMLSEEDGIVGESLEAATERVVSLAIEFGYVDEENTVVGVSVVGGNTEKYEKSVGDALDKATEGMELTLTLDSEAAYSVQRHLAALKEKYPDNERIQALTPASYKLVLSASEGGEITVEAAAELDTEALLGYVNEKHDKLEAFATEAFIQARALAESAYERAVGLAEDAVYYEYLISNNPMGAWYSVISQTYMIAARGLEFTADTWVYLEKLSNKPLNDSQVALALDALELQAEDRALIENSDGEVTVASIEAYADKCFKNSEAGAELEAKMNELTAALENTETELQAVVAEMLREYDDEVETIIELGRSCLNTLDTMLVFIPDSIKQTLTKLGEDYEELAGELKAIFREGETPTAEKLYKAAEAFKAKGTELKDEAIDGLTEEQLAEIRAKQDEAVEKLTKEKAKLDEAIDEAEAEAKAHLAALREERLARISGSEK